MRKNTTNLQLNGFGKSGHQMDGFESKENAIEIAIIITIRFRISIVASDRSLVINVVKNKIYKRSMKKKNCTKK